MHKKSQKPEWRVSQSAILAVMCLVTGLQLAHAQDPNMDEPRASNNISGPSVTQQARDAASANRNAGQNTSTLNFVDADIESVIAAVGDYTNTTFIIDPRVKGTVTLVSEKPLTKAQAFQLLTSVLRLRGYTVVTGDGYTKVVPEADAKLQASPLQSGKAGKVRGDQIATQVFHLKYESAANLVAVLRPLISPNNTINANPSNNSLVITDYADNLQRLGKIIAALDETAGSDVDVVPVRYASAIDIAVTANRLLEETGAPAGNAGRVTILAYPMTNSILVRAPSKARANLAKTLIAKLDEPTAQPGNVHVVYLKNAEAVKLAQTLRAVVTSDSSAINSASSASNRSSTATTSFSSPSSSGSNAPASSSFPSSSNQTQLSSGGAGGFIQADPTTNTLIITASEPVYRNLRAVIDQLDARRAQVYIESLIVEVSATKAAELGVQWAGMSGDASSSVRVGALTGFSTKGDNLINQAVAKAAAGTPLPPGNGLTLGIINQAGLGALAHALESDSSTNILSMPNLITLDNEEAKIIVGQNVPFITGQYTTVASAGAAGVNPFQTVERQDIGLTLRVRPQISEGGTVRMAIYQEVSAVVDSSNPAGLITTKRALDTNVLVDNGQIIVLGGLIDDNLQDSVEKVPGLGDIPLLGGLFRYKKRTHVKTNLMVFLRPTIVRDNEESVNLAADRYDYIRNTQLNSLTDKSGMLPDNDLPSMDAPKLPPLQDGQLVGGPVVNLTKPKALKTEPDNPANPPPSSPQGAAPQQPAAPAPQQ